MNGVCGGGGHAENRAEDRKQEKQPEMAGGEKREKVTDRSETNVRKAPRVD